MLILLMFGVVLHTRDLRIYDNRTVCRAYDECECVLHVFVLNPEQLQKEKSGDESLVFSLNTHAIECMHNSLLDLNLQLQERESQLVILHSTISQAISILKEEFPFQKLYISQDYSPYAKKREQELEELSKQFDFTMHLVFEHVILDNPKHYLKPVDLQMYTVFTPMYKNCLRYEIPKPLEYGFNSLVRVETISKLLIDTTLDAFIFLDSLYEKNEHLLVKGGRKEALDMISTMSKYDYSTLRDYPSLLKTTQLSAHHKFGTISMRESCYLLIEQFKEFSEHIIRELFWHDFYILIAKHYPYVFTESFQKKYNAIEWDNDCEKFIAWCEGRTGFPIVDAGMRELNTTGYMHNRVRMIVASFLTKDLHINWRLGEKYFASKLTDYDCCINNGSWQWAASTGCDAQPYFRIFNPWLQQKRFDEKCEYIKKWIPELHSVESSLLHNLDTQRPLFMPTSYPRPIVDHQVEKQRALEMFKIE